MSLISVFFRIFKRIEFGYSVSKTLNSLLWSKNMSTNVINEHLVFQIFLSDLSCFLDILQSCPYTMYSHVNLSCGFFLLDFPKFWIYFNFIFYLVYSFKIFNLLNKKQISIVSLNKYADNFKFY